MDEISNICCVGAGYVGGPTMAMIAHKCPDLEVTVVDYDADRIAAFTNASAWSRTFSIAVSICSVSVRTR